MSLKPIFQSPCNKESLDRRGGVGGMESCRGAAIKGMRCIFTKKQYPWRQFLSASYPPFKGEFASFLPGRSGS
jgi:hypothetical protein